MTQKYSNVQDVPIALQVFLAADKYDYNSDPFTVSATTLIKPLRQTILTSRLPPSMGLVPLRDMTANRLGAAIHEGIESAWMDGNREAALKALGYPQRVIDKIRLNPTDEELAADPDMIPFYMEQRLSKKYGKWTVTGKFDFIGEGIVQDFKSTSVFQYLNQTNATKYELQGSIYRALDPVKIHGDELHIHYILKDWMRSQAGIGDYPAHQIYTQKFNLMSIPETEAFIRKKLALLEQYWDEPEENIPECTDEELWRSKPVWKYYKNPEKRARSTANFDNAAAAFTRLAADKNVGIVVEKPGEIKACRFCPAFAMCSQKDALVAAGQLTL